MKLASLVNVGPTETVGQKVSQSKDVGSSFLTVQSIVTFPVASALIAGLWKLAQHLMPGPGSSKLVPVVIALAVGALIWLISTSDERLKLRGRNLLISIGIGLINSLYLAMSVLGIGTI